MTDPSLSAALPGVLPGLPPLPLVPGVRHRYVHVGGLRVHVAEAGPASAPPLVLVHGWPQHWYEWRLLVPLLADDFRLVMPDLRGSGWTDAPATGYAKEQLATDLLGLLDVLGLDRVGLVGHDWGGWTGFLAALRAPQRFRGFLALGITHPFQQPDLRVLQAWRGTYQVLLSTPVLAERVLRTAPHVIEAAIRVGSRRREAFSAADLAVYSSVVAEAGRARASSRLYRTFLLREAVPVLRGRYRGQLLRVPTRLVVGAYDPAIGRSLLRGWEDCAEDMSVHLLAGCGHFVPEEEPEAVAWQARTLFGAG
jgi:pimeloyl-ACP methyl ester carboxylesterase